MLVVVHEYGHYSVARVRREGAALLGRLRQAVSCAGSASKTGTEWAISRAAARRLREDARRARRRRRRSAPKTCRARSTGRALASASRSSPRARSPTRCWRSCCSTARVHWRRRRSRAAIARPRRCAEPPPSRPASRRRAVWRARFARRRRMHRVRSWSDLRWQLLTRSATIELRGATATAPAAARRSPPSMSPASATRTSTHDSCAGSASCRGGAASLGDVVAGGAAQEAGLRSGRSRARDRRRDGRRRRASRD